MLSENGRQQKKPKTQKQAKKCVRNFHRIWYNDIFYTRNVTYLIANRVQHLKNYRRTSPQQQARLRQQFIFYYLRMIFALCSLLCVCFLFLSPPPSLTFFASLLMIFFIYLVLFLFLLLVLYFREHWTVVHLEWILFGFCSAIIIGLNWIKKSNM